MELLTTTSKETLVALTLPQSAANDNHSDVDATMTNLVAALEAAVDVRVADGSFADVEETALRVGNEATRQVLERVLQRMSDDLGGGDVLIDGELHWPHNTGAPMIHSLVGPLTVRRSTYRQAGVHNAPTKVGLDLIAGLVEDMTPALAERVAMGNGDGDSRALYRQLMASKRRPPSRAVLAKRGTRVGEALHEATATIEAAARRSEKLARAAATIVVGLDRTAVPMEEDLPEGSRGTERDEDDYIRKRPKPVEVNHRMAYVGTVALVDEQGDMLRVFKYAATPEDGPGQALHGMMQDVRRGLRQDPALRVLVVQDAAREMWTLVTEALADEPSVSQWDELIDHPHAMSHLWAAADAIDDSTAALMALWKKMLREDDDAVDVIHARIQHEIGQGYIPTLRIILEEEDTYLENNKHRLHYAALRNAGCPIGSGATEGACKSFVAARCKKSGQRWRNPGLRAALACRTQLLNDRLPRTMKTLRRQRYTADVRPAA
jgi:hypothetical protein